MKRVLLAAAAALAMAGCMPSGPSPEALASQNKAYAECQARSKTAVELVRCQNVAYDRYSRPYVRDPDIMTLIQARRLAIAEKVDRGQITPAESEAEAAAVAAEGNTEIQRRTAQADAAAAAIWAASAPSPQPSQPSYAPAQSSGFVPPWAAIPTSLRPHIRAIRAMADMWDIPATTMGPSTRESNKQIARSAPPRRAPT